MIRTNIVVCLAAPLLFVLSEAATGQTDPIRVKIVHTDLSETILDFAEDADIELTLDLNTKTINVWDNVGSGWDDSIGREAKRGGVHLLTH